jgi:hypothetical protein
MLTTQQNIVYIATAVVCSAVVWFFTKGSVMNKAFLSTISTLVVSYILIFNLHVGETENYGGPIRVTRKIPMTDCYKFCDNNYSMCAHMYPGDNVGKCDTQWRACRAECYFPNVQRF